VIGTDPESCRNVRTAPEPDPVRRSACAFLAIVEKSADAVAWPLKKIKVIVDARDGLIRICPDILTADEERVEVVGKLAYAVRGK